MHMRHKQQGFTMIELIMVIVILGILTAVALPKFYDMQTEARIAKMKSAAAALRSGYAIAHSAHLVSPDNANSVTMEGTAVPLVNGYPDVGATAVVSGAVLAAGGLADYTTAVADNVLTVTPDGTHGACAITYTETASANTPPAVNETALNTRSNCD